MATTPNETKGILHQPNLDKDNDQAQSIPLSADSTIPQSEGQGAEHAAAVRFSSVNQEIEPAEIIKTSTTQESDPTGLGTSAQDLTPEAQEELRQLSHQISTTKLQGRRMSNFAFEPVSLPTSRVPSHEGLAQSALGERVNAAGRSPRLSPSIKPTQSPPLHPADSQARANEPAASIDAAVASGDKAQSDTAMLSPEISPARAAMPPPTSIGRVFGSEHDITSSLPSSSRPSSGEQSSTRPTTISTGSSGVSTHPKHVPVFSVGVSGDSLPVSREPSPSSTPASHSGTTTPSSRPFTPAGDKDDPYARNKRPPQSKNLDGIDARFKFSGKDTRRASSHLAGGIHRMGSSGGESKNSDEKAHSHGFLGRGGKKIPLDDNASGIGGKHGSLTDLKRFFKLGHKHKSPSPSSGSSGKSTKGTKTPPHQLPASNVPFADDHGLQSRYGKFGRVLGAGAGGSVRLLKRSSDGVTFAVKEFRARHAYETEREYGKKVTAEFCIGSTLHHGNIIETLDIVHEKGRWYEVMEYAPFDLFAGVMTGKMSREEVACSFLQIVAGVTYLHSMGLAHRDLKLDNVVVNEFGIMKIIDFGSASVFRYPFESDIVLVTGIVGSDPYLAPEVYDNNKYDPQPADIWSLAIIFCCMSLRRFPWKAPRVSDNSYKLFVSPPNPGQPGPDIPTSRRSSDHRPRSTADLPSTTKAANAESNGASRQISEDSTQSHHHHHHHHHHPKSEPVTQQNEPSPAASPPPPPSTTSTASSSNNPPKPEVIKGPWRLLRLLPRESRTIIGRMLEINPRKRATLEEVLADPWVQGSPVCRQEDEGTVIRAPGHVHTLEPSAGAGAADGKV